MLFLSFLISLIFAAGNTSFSKDSMIAHENWAKNGEKLFKANCAGCHLNGQNLIKPNKPVIGSLKLASKQSFREFLSSPPQPMPNFKNITTMPGQFDALYTYVISLMGN